MTSMHHKYMHLCRLSDAYNQMLGLSARSKTSAMFIARKTIGINGDVKSATHEQMDAMISYLKSKMPDGAVLEPDDGRRRNPGRKPLPPHVKSVRTKMHKSKIAKCFRERYASDPIFAIRHSMRRTVADALRRAGFVKKQSSIKIVGCTPCDLKRHIELQFLPGMSWENRREWHVDHIVPLSSATNEDELLALCHFTNLRPLWAADNQKKSNQRTHLI